jgi:serine/threonine protein kinase
VLDATKDYAKTMVGTPYYLSPEIIEDKPYNYKSDVWACGVVLYEMTTLKHPFDADSLVILARQILQDRYPDPDPGYSPDMVSLIRNMLAKDAKLRPWIHEILQSPFLQGPMNHANVRYGLDLDLTPYTPKVEASPSSGGIVPHGDDGDGDDGRDAYDEDFEDYSGESDAEEEHDRPGDLHKSVAKLRLGHGGGAGGGTSSASGAAAAPPTAMSSPSGIGMGGSGSMSKIGAKAEALREYLHGQMEAAQFAASYALTREGQDGVPPEDLQRRLAEVLGPEKAQAFFQLFQLLCFLEDIAVSSPAGMGGSS